MLKTDSKSLVGQTLAGDSTAFDQLYRAYQAKIYSTVANRTGYGADLDDLVQITFMRAYQGLSGFRGEAAFSTWLTQIAINVCTTHLRTRQVRRNGLSIVQEPETQLRNSWEPFRFKTPEEMLQKKERDEMVHDKIRQLPPHHRKAVQMRYIKGRSYDEIATELDIPIGTVKTWLFRAHKKLKKLVQETDLLG